MFISVKSRSSSANNNDIAEMIYIILCRVSLQKVVLSMKIELNTDGKCKFGNVQ